MTASEEPSCVGQALAKVLETLLDPAQFSVNTCRYADMFDDCWKMKPSVTAEAGRTELVVVDGHFAAVGEHAGNASAIAWIVAYAMSNKAEKGTRYVITGAELPSYLRDIASLLRRAIAPHVVVGLRDETAFGWVDVPDLIARLQEPVRPDVSARNRVERLLVHEFLAPEEHHKVSNLVSPMLLSETLKSAGLHIDSSDEQRGVAATKGLLRALGLLETERTDNSKALEDLRTAVESAHKRIKAACGGNPIAMHLVEDNKAFWPILDAVLGQKCIPHDSLADQESAPWATANSILFLDMRLSSADEGKAIIKAPGFLYAFTLSPERPYMPIVTFSTTQQIKLPKTVKTESEKTGVHNIITGFSKPSLAAQGRMNAEVCIESLKDLANAAVEAVMMVEQSRAILALTGGGESAAARYDAFYAPLYDHRWLEVLLMPAQKRSSEPPATDAYWDMELIRKFAMRRATDKRMAEALRVDVTDRRAGWVWALAVIRVWLATDEEPEGLIAFIGRLEAGLVPDYATTNIEEVPIKHPNAQKDTIHAILLWAEGDHRVDLAVGIKTIIEHIRQQYR